MAEEKKTDFVKDWWSELSPSMKMLVIVIIVIIVIVIVGKVRTAIETAKMNQYNSRAEINATKVRDVRPLVDNIYQKLDGTNLYIYPEVVNKLANLSDAELQASVDYWDSEYASQTGKNLYAFINAEWDGGEYAPALEKLERKGFV